MPASIALAPHAKSVSRRTRCFAYGRHDGTVAWLPRDSHDYLQRYPRQVGSFHLTGFLGYSRLLRAEERQLSRRVILDARG